MRVEDVYVLIGSAASTEYNEEEEEERAQQLKQERLARSEASRLPGAGMLAKSARLLHAELMLACS